MVLEINTLQNQAKSTKTKRYGKDIDQVHEEIQRQAAGLTRTSKLDTTVQEAEAEELPGAGDYPCVACSRHFISTEALATHTKTKVHKRRMKALKDEPYSQKEAELAAGLGTDNKRRPKDNNDENMSVATDANQLEAH
ncbi:hypothetical protein EMMF5_003555 [Cystobasidiomycetes sp. EMM_F5]